MRALVVLSGTVRSPEKSLATLAMMREAGWDLDVSIQTWFSMDGIQGQHWSWDRPVDPCPAVEFLEQYRPTTIRYDSWASFSKRFQANVDRWIEKHGCKTFTNLGPLGMFWGMYAAADQTGILEPACGGHALERYDLVLRLRFDCKLLRRPEEFDREPGWAVPIGMDFSAIGLNDQVGWYWINPENLSRSVYELSAYFETFWRVDRMMRGGANYHPESWLGQNMKESGVAVRRVPCPWLIH